MIPIGALQAIHDRESLFTFLRDQLNWPVDPEDTFTYRGPQVADEIAGRVEVSQLVPFGANDPFVIMLAEFQTPLRRTDLREILRAIRKEMRTRAAHQGRTLEDIVFVCATGGYQGIRFAQFKEIDGRQPKLSAFGWNRDFLHETRTLREVNLPALFAPRNILDEIDWDDARGHWLAAWDVDRVTDVFFREFHATFDAVKGKIATASPGVDGHTIHTFTLTLMNRLLFSWFIQQKKWLSHEPAYLVRQWEMQRQREGVGFARSGSFYDEILCPLFFLMLNTPRDARLQHHPEVVERMGDFPYLNGGLFEENLLDKHANPCDPARTIFVPNEAIALLLSEIEDADRRPRGLFLRWHFTIEESMPDDVDVAIDPEMLGKVFEELMNEVTGDSGDTKRHETGAYYTPRPIVSFMCREGLKGYLGGSAGIEKFVDTYDASDLPRPELVLERLQKVRVCDPACGSGAYLLGMLQELLRLRRALFVSKNVDPNSDYDRKLEIIRQSLYGVDIEPTAVEIARLRLWLSLAVDFDDGGDLSRVPALPNLDFLIEQGDSVTTPSPSADQRILFDQVIRDYANLKRQETACSDPATKVRLREEIRQCKADIRTALFVQEALPFDWRVDFAEVFYPAAEPVATMAGSFAFANEVDRQTTLLQPESTRPAKGGFDIILANPPYVRQELIKEQKPELKRVYGDLYSGTADLYVYFYYRALQLLKSDGMLVFISSNKWLRTGYGAKLRAYIASTMCVKSITDFGDLPVFQSATAYPMIIVAQKGNRQNGLTFTSVPSLDEPYPDVPAILATFGALLPAEAIAESDWKLTDPASVIRLRRMSAIGIPLARYVQEKLYSGIKTGLNEAFVINDRTRAELIASDQHSAEVIMPLITGKDIRKWLAEPHGQWLIVTPIGVEIRRYPAILAHLTQWQASLETRCDQGNHWWELRPCDYYNAFSKPKIVFPDIAKESRFSFDTTGAFLGNTAYIIPIADLYLLGVLNSQIVLDFYLELSSQVRGGYLRFIRQYVEHIPIPEAPEAERTAIAALVQKCLDAHGVGCTAWEVEINERVARLYGV